MNTLYLRRIVLLTAAVLAVNPAGCAMFGYTAKEFLGKRIEVLMPARFRKRHVGHQKRYMAEPRLREMGASPVVTGNLKYDAAIGFDPAAEEKSWREQLALGDAPVVVAGSTHDPEERILADTYKKLQKAVPGVRLILAPRHLERVEEVQKAVEAAELKCYKRTQLSQAGPSDGVIGRLGDLRC